LKSKRDVFKQQIENLQKELSDLENKKRNLFGQTAENFATKKSNEYYIRNIFYKDNKLKKYLFTDEEFDELEDKTLFLLNKI
jgi:hypothetical protein